MKRETPVRVIAPGLCHCHPWFDRPAPCGAPLQVAAPAPSTWVATQARFSVAMGQHIPASCVPSVQEMPAAQAMLFIKHAHELQPKIRESAFGVFSDSAQQHSFRQSFCRCTIGHEGACPVDYVPDNGFHAIVVTQKILYHYDTDQGRKIRFLLSKSLAAPRRQGWQAPTCLLVACEMEQLGCWNPDEQRLARCC